MGWLHCLHARVWKQVFQCSLCTLALVKSLFLSFSLSLSPAPPPSLSLSLSLSRSLRPLSGRACAARGR